MDHRNLQGGRRGVLLFSLSLIAGAVLVPSALGADANLSITKTDSVDPATEGENFVYRIAVANSGPDPASGVEVTDKLGGSLDYVSARTSQGSCERKGKTVTCALGTVASGEDATVRITVRATKTGTVENTATVSTVDTDAYGENDSDTETTKVVAAGEPPRTPMCGGLEATKVGTKGDDLLRGTGKRDVIVGLGGNDTIRGFDGHDVLCGNGGHDTIRGHAGKDRIKGHAGDDDLRGGGGDDVINGGAGADLLKGGGGNDILRGGSGRDVLRGGRGNDTLRGGRNGDRCFGGAGRDTKRSC